jgi:vanillate O-demethylase ferredoxin subunit
MDRRFRPAFGRNIAIAQSRACYYFKPKASAGEPPMAENTEIEVVLKRSGLTFLVPPDKSILQVLIEEGIDPMYDCQRGECGICQVAVLEGVPDHRDHILSDDEHAGNKVMQICVSRAKTPRLVLDL